MTNYIWWNLRRAARHPSVLRPSHLGQLVSSYLTARGRDVSPAVFVEVLTGGAAVADSNSLPDELRRFKRDCIFGLVRALGPEVVVETGCGAGFTTAHILEAMRVNGHGILYSIDSAAHFDPSYYGYPPSLSCGGMVPEHLRGSNWHLSMGGAEQELPLILEGLGKVDLFIHDSLHTREQMSFEIRAAWPYIREGGVLVAHDVWRPFADFARIVNREFVVSQRFGGMVK